MIYPSDVLVGVPRPARPLVEHFNWGVDENPDWETWPAYKERAAELRGRIERQKTHLFPVGWERIREGCARFFTPEQEDALGSLFFAGGYQGHTVPDYFRLLRDGIGGTLERVRAYEANTEDPKKLLLYRAMTVLLEGFTAYARTYADAAEETAARSEGEARERFLAVAENCRYVSVNRPETLYQAAQLVWFFSLWDWVDCVGRFDQYVYPFYERSVREGDVFPAEDIVAAIYVKFAEHGVHNLPLGGAFTGACSLLSGGVWWGLRTWAMPDGRFAGEPLGNTIGPRTGADHCGVTAMLSSVMKLPLKKGIGGTTVNVLVPPQHDENGGRAQTGRGAHDRLHDGRRTDGAGHDGGSRRHARREGTSGAAPRSHRARRRLLRFVQ